MTTWRRIWWAAAGLTGAAGGLGTPGVMTKGPALTMLIMMAFTGAGMGWAFAGESPGIRRQIVRGAGLFTAPCLMPGLLYLLGPQAWALVGALLLASPTSLRLLRRLGARLPLDHTERAALATPDEALRRQWLESTKQLHNASSDDDRMLIVEIRAQILDDLLARYGGRLPDYVWATLQGSGGPDRS